MDNGVILVLTHSQDDCAALVVKALERRGADFVRFDTDEFQSKVKASLHLDGNGVLSCTYLFPDRELRFDEVGVVWNRRIHAPNIEVPEGLDPEIKTWMEEETSGALNISFTLFTCPVVNPWENNERLRFNKMIQMQRAASLGLEIPPSLITNDLEVMRQFWKEVEYEVAFKKIRKGFFQFRDGRRMLVHTNRIPREALTEESLQRMRFAPMFFQEHIPKKFDIRSVIVGDRVFSVAIHSQEIPEARVDYRTAMALGKLTEIPHEVFDLGDSLNGKLVAFTRSFGLTFSVIDLILTPDDRIVFLEDNPNGQWAWLEFMTGVPIAHAFADVLMRLSVH